MLVADPIDPAPGASETVTSSTAKFGVRLDTEGGLEEVGSKSMTSKFVLLA
jgi:hypothetical protein